MKRDLWIIGLLICFCFVGMTPVPARAADADRQAYIDLLNDLEQKIKDADRRMVAHPSFLEELRNLVKQYRAKIRVVFLSEDFSDGDYTKNPTWVVDSGTFQILPNHRLSSEVAAEEPAEKPAATPPPTEKKTSPLSGILKEILKTPQEEKEGEKTASAAPAPAPKEARIHTLASIGPAFEVDLTLVSRSTWGSLEIVLLGGEQNIPYYRIIYRQGPSKERPIEIIRERDGRSYTIDTANQYPSIDDGSPHRIQWIRDSQGQMRVLVDGKEVLSTYELYYRSNFSGLAIVNKGGTYAWGPIAVYQAQESKKP